MHARHSAIGSIAITGLALLALWSGSARADGVADFYRGKELRLIIGASVGGGYDHLFPRSRPSISASHIPGNPDHRSRRTCRPAAAWRRTNNIYNVAPKDGTVIGSIQNTVPFEPFFENKQALFDATKLNWLGTPTTEIAHVSGLAHVESAERCRTRGRAI